MGCLIVFQSMTHAQRAASVLSHQGIFTTVVRPPLSAGKGSCSSALRISDQCMNVAVPLMMKLSFRPIGYFQYEGDGSLREVFP